MSLREHRNGIIHVTDRINLDCGETLAGFHLAYTVYGDMQKCARKLLLFHGLSGSSEIHKWWPKFGINHLPNDTAVIAFNSLGSCHGSSGPLTTQPFPVISIGDTVRALKLGLNEMGITKIDTIFGCSLGGLQALEMFLTYPKLARKFIVGAAAPLTMPVKLFNLAQLRMLPATFNADLHGTQLLERMAFARYFFRLSCTTPEAIAEFSTNGEDVGDYYLMESTEFQTRFNPYSYALLLGAITNYQLGSQAVRSVNNDFDDAELHLIGIQGDLFTPVDSMKVIFRDLHQLGYKVHYQEFSTIYGHEAWIVDGEKFYDQIKTIL